MAIREAIYQPIPHVERPISDPPRAQSAGRLRLRRPVASDYALMGMALLAGPANVIMELSPSRRWPRGAGESGRERPDRPPSDQAGAHHLHLHRRGNRRHRRPEGGLPPGGERGARAGLLHARQPGVSTTRSIPNCNCGWRPASTRAASISTAPWSENGRRGSRSPSIARACLWAPHCRCHRRCGRRTGQPSTGTGRSRWTRYTSTMRSANTCIPIAVSRIRGSRCRARCGGSRTASPC